MRRTSGEVESAVFTVYRALRKSIFYEELASAIGNVAPPLLRCVSVSLCGNGTSVGRCLLADLENTDHTGNFAVGFAVGRAGNPVGGFAGS